MSIPHTFLGAMMREKSLNPRRAKYEIELQLPTPWLEASRLDNWCRKQKNENGLRICYKTFTVHFEIILKPSILESSAAFFKWLQTFWLVKGRALVTPNRIGCSAISIRNRVWSLKDKKDVFQLLKCERDLLGGSCLCHHVHTNWWPGLIQMQSIISLQQLPSSERFHSKARKWSCTLGTGDEEYGCPNGFSLPCTLHYFGKKLAENLPLRLSACSK